MSIFHRFVLLSLLLGIGWSTESSADWLPAANMITARSQNTQYTTTLLSNGKVLVAGGLLGNTYLASAELYEPTTNSWISTDSMVSARSFHSATRLSNGKVLVAGGLGNNDLVIAELFDPTTNSWSSAGNMTGTRLGHTATLLPNGKVLMTGGNGNFSSSAELYDPTTNNWSSAASMTPTRVGHTATLLSNGKVLMAGGSANNSMLVNAALYDPTNNSWSNTGSMTGEPNGHTATLLSNGKVLVAGGYGDYNSSVRAELYDPTTNTWSSVASMPVARGGHAATMLPNGKVLITGGSYCTVCTLDLNRPPLINLASAELYNPTTNSWSSAGSMATAPRFPIATLLLNGKVLVAGGGSVELYDPGIAVVVEFYNTTLDHYFLTADANEAVAVDNGSAGPGWSRTGTTFKSSGDTPVCRFYGSQSPGPNSHFFTANADECAFLKQLQANSPATEKRWNFESLDFLTMVPANGNCPSGTTPVYRAYNNGWARGIDSNHRITTSIAAIQQEVDRGWINEGVVMCVPL